MDGRVRFRSRALSTLKERNICARYFSQRTELAFLEAFRR